MPRNWLTKLQQNNTANRDNTTVEKVNNSITKQ